MRFCKVITEGEIALDSGRPGDCGSRTLALPVWVGDKQAVMQARKGSLQAGIDQVATPCLNSSAAIVVLCAAFAAPLLRRTKIASFGLNLHGVSKAGKTSALLAGASVAGIGVESRLPNFRSTSAVRGELCRAFNDQMLPLKEVGLIAGKNTTAIARKRNTACDIRLLPGRSATGFGGARTRSTLRFRISINEAH